jgi:hypothetical protein
MYSLRGNTAISLKWPKASDSDVVMGNNGQDGIGMPGVIKHHVLFPGKAHHCRINKKGRQKAPAIAYR